MAFAFSHLLTATVTVAARSGVSNGGDPSFAAQATLPARVQYRSERVISLDGTERESTTQIYTDQAIAIDSRVWTPDDDTSDSGASKHPIAVAKSSSPDGSSTLFVTYL